MMRIDIITLFPQLFNEHLKLLPYKRALEKGLATINLHNLRDFALDAYGTVDDKPYGGGVGMILRPEPIYRTLQMITREKNSKVVVFTPAGKLYEQKKCAEYSKLAQLILICGRYEGIDQRVLDYMADEVVSVGNFILSGGELAALIVSESVLRLIPGVLEKPQSTTLESFSPAFDGGVEHPQYTRPENFMGMKVPEILLSGDHKKIQEWKRN